MSVAQNPNGVPRILPSEPPQFEIAQNSDGTTRNLPPEPPQLNGATRNLSLKKNIKTKVSTKGANDEKGLLSLVSLFFIPCLKKPPDRTFQNSPGTENRTPDESPLRVSTQAVAKAQAAHAKKQAPNQPKLGDRDALPEGGVYKMKDKPTLSDDEMDDESSFLLELTQEEQADLE